jgi:hypothetical protein
VAAVPVSFAFSVSVVAGADHFVRAADFVGTAAVEHFVVGAAEHFVVVAAEHFVGVAAVLPVLVDV